MEIELSYMFKQLNYIETPFMLCMYVSHITCNISIDIYNLD